jgi:D-glycero-D-manno-heptose 1,7-bisphosphate phosphatase
MAHGQSLIILDRDGVLNQTLHNPREARPDSPLRVDEVLVFPWVPGLLRQLTRAGYTLAVASNQPAFAKGKVSLQALQQVHERVLAEAQRDGGVISSSHLCFHRSEDGCACRKPQGGLLREALSLYPAALKEQSWMVGDRATDVLAGVSVGVQTALLGDTGGAERRALAASAVQPSFYGEDLQDFGRFLLGTADAAQPQHH